MLAVKSALSTLNAQNIHQVLLICLLMFIKVKTGLSWSELTPTSKDINMTPG